MRYIGFASFHYWSGRGAEVWLVKCWDILAQLFQIIPSNSENTITMNTHDPLNTGCTQTQLYFVLIRAKLRLSNLRWGVQTVQRILHHQLRALWCFHCNAASFHQQQSKQSGHARCLKLSSLEGTIRVQTFTAFHTRTTKTLLSHKIYFPPEPIFSVAQSQIMCGVRCGTDQQLYRVGGGVVLLTNLGR